VQPNLDVLAGGVPGQSPVDLLSSPRMAALLEEAAREYEFVVLDSPALLGSPADVRTLSTLADSVLLTVRHGSTPREAVSFAISQLKDVIGVVLNRAGSPDIIAFDPRMHTGAPPAPDAAQAQRGGSVPGSQEEATC
jgi:Mrp family chromosome partitioning ATPase